MNDTISPLSAWYQAIRPKTLTAAVTPVIVGSAIAMAEGGFHWDVALVASFCAVMIQIGTNLYNDVADFERGTDTADRLGPTRVTQAGWLQPGQVRSGAYISFLLATVGGAYLVAIGGWPVLLIGAISILAGLAYTAGPFPLAYNGFGDLFVIIFFGFVGVCGTVYIHLGWLPGIAWLAALSTGSTITALLVVNNVRDVDTDRAAGRRTIPVLFGRDVGVVEYGLLLGLAYASPLFIVLLDLSNLGVLVTWLSLPYAVWLVRFVAATRGKELNRALAGTARIVLIHGLLLSIGLVLSGLNPTF